MKKTLRERQLTAEQKANHWLARANELREAGKNDSKAMEKAQKWLDKLNELEGLGNGQ
jgi:carbonic anhydrase